MEKKTYPTDNITEAAAIETLTGEKIGELVPVSTGNHWSKILMLFGDREKVPRGGRLEIVYTDGEGSELRAPLLPGGEKGKSFQEIYRRILGEVMDLRRKIEKENEKE